MVRTQISHLLLLRLSIAVHHLHLLSWLQLAIWSEVNSGLEIVLIEQVRLMHLLCLLLLLMLRAIMRRTFAQRESILRLLICLYELDVAHLVLRLLLLLLLLLLVA